MEGCTLLCLTRMSFSRRWLKKMPIIDLVNIERGVKNVSCLILSNTCDMDLSNSRMFPASIMYAPIINLTTYISVLQNKVLIVAKLKTTFQISNNKNNPNNLSSCKFPNGRFNSFS